MERNLRQPDRLSELPDDVLLSILSQIPHREAAATAILARRWRYLFSSLPSLYLTRYSLLPAEDSDQSSDGEFEPSRWLDTVFAILAARRCPLVAVHFEFDIVDHDADAVSQVLHSLCDSGVEELSIAQFSKPFYGLPSGVLSCRTIKHLILNRCRLTIPCTYPGLQCLTSLSLLVVFITDEDFRRLVSRLHALEDLTVVYCSKLTNLVISAPVLNKLAISTVKPLNIVLENAPRLASVTVNFAYLFYDGSWRNNDEDGCSHDRWYPNDEDEESEVSRLIRFLMQLSHIESLTLKFPLPYNMRLDRENVSLPKSLPSGHFLMNLKKLDLSMHFDDKYFLLILTCLLNSSPNLRELIVRQDKPNGCAKLAEADYWDKQIPPECVRNQLSTATLFTHYEVWNNWLDLAWFLLSYSRVLNRMIISYREESYNQSAWKELFLLRSAFPGVRIEYNTESRL
ncbi:F-box/FBD/LRR-repeat protein At3g26920-like [Phoenix dactylifera]|uniref:F-box/FBD/LRR-repeat protein At3g26920-like n=1 Tax=Phoenix dactylifera TaxID=42345 RepID=A0A8B7C7W4_PHODC|nr:F-box/FBD/LRR-repeat protein At3g26920-like [Phoenix dactylifera]XP_038981487.1 F-box/FBD/LRR-repeat protein At3g26920-like [Phoenix dactylifera]